MASDIVKFERKTFLSSLDEAKTKLPDSLYKEFQQIKECIDDADQKNVWSYTDGSSSLLPILNDLNDHLAECIDFAAVSETISTLNPLHVLFIRNMKQSLRNKKDELAQKIALLTFESQISGSNTTSANFFPTGRYTSFDSNSDSSQLIGIDEQEKQIRDLISDKEYRAIGVYGIGGSGKTAVIHKVLNSPSISRGKFSPIIWLCLSDIHSQEDEEFEVNIVKFMLCELGFDVDRWTDMDPSKEVLLKRLKNLLESKKYLIVFDDVWEENEFYSNLGDVRGGNINTVWNRLWEALPRDSGGKIIITSRLKEVAEKMVGEKNLIHMKPLNRENCRMILEDGIGFVGYAKQIQDLLNRSGFVAIGIHGPSSSAKTALVRKVLSSPSVREKFELKIWVPVWHIFLNHIIQKDANAVENMGNEIVKYMLKELRFDVDKLLDDDMDLEEIVYEELGRKKYMIVLIDVWHKNYGYRMEDKRNDVWKRLSGVWPKHGEGTVIVTSDAEEVVAEMVAGEKNLVHVRLPELASRETSEVASDRQYISDELVDQCNGLPLAAKTLATIIREKGLQS